MRHPVDHILGAGGLLDAHLEHYEPRLQQLEMARTVHHALKTDTHAVIEAATGTGKTLAYLIPAILNGGTIVISTATKALQAQILQKDIPLLSRIFTNASPPRPFSAINLKGRSNYLCLHRFEQQRDTISFNSARDAALWRNVTRWASKTTTGDRGTIPNLPDRYTPWAEVSATSQQCHGLRCKHHERCFVTQLRRDAREADLLIVNHHLFFADVALKRLGLAGLLPDYDGVIFDEAHHLESIATSAFGVRFSNFRLRELILDARRDLEEANALSPLGFRHLRGVKKAASSLFDLLFKSVEPGTHDLRATLDETLRPRLERRYQRLTNALELFSGWLEASKEASTTERLVGRCRDIIADAVTVLDTENDALCHTIERTERGVFLDASPISIGDLFRETILNRGKPLIFTSATLTTSGDFSFFLSRLGMTAQQAPITVQLDSVFDYNSNVRLFVPWDLPSPREAGYEAAAHQLMRELTQITSGRAFLLFTSHRAMEQAHRRLKTNLDLPVMKQGERSRGALISAFCDQLESVLFATGSFWEGVSVEGEALSLVVMDKLPFPNPSDPLTQARMQAIEQRGGSAFHKLLLPTAIIALKQGFGRLIRTRRDSGIVAILDSRLLSSSYGRRFLDSLPDVPVFHQLDEVHAWWHSDDRDPQGPSNTRRPHHPPEQGQLLPRPASRPATGT